MATAKDFAVDSTIRSISNKTRKGIVIGNSLKDGDQVLAVEWADGTLAKVNVKDITPALSIEEEFKLVQNEVNDKLAQAATLIRDAAALAEAQGKDLQAYDHDADDAMFNHYLIENAMDAAGWNTSSWHC